MLDSPTVMDKGGGDKGREAGRGEERGGEEEGSRDGDETVRGGKKDRGRRQGEEPRGKVNNIVYLMKSMYDNEEKEEQFEKDLSHA